MGLHAERAFLVCSARAADGGVASPPSLPFQRASEAQKNVPYLYRLHRSVRKRTK